MRTLSSFLLITFAASWTLWLAASVLDPGVTASALTLVGVFAPGIVALGVTMRAEGASGVRTAVSRLFKADVGVRWFVVALTFMLSVKLGAAALHRAAYGAWPAFGTAPVVLMIAATLVSLISLGQAGEELGWRGFALPRLGERLGLPLASVLLGVIWAAWHLPFFFIFPAADTHGQSFPLYLSQVTGLSVAFTWLWWRAKGSLLVTMLLHAAVNNTKDIVPSVNPGATDVWTLSASHMGWLTVAVLWTVAAAFLWDMRGAPSALPGDTGAGPPRPSR